MKRLSVDLYCSEETRFSYQAIALLIGDCFHTTKLYHSQSTIARISAEHVGLEPFCHFNLKGILPL